MYFFKSDSTYNKNNVRFMKIFTMHWKAHFFKFHSDLKIKKNIDHLLSRQHNKLARNQMFMPWCKSTQSSKKCIFSKVIPITKIFSVSRKFLQCNEKHIFSNLILTKARNVYSVQNFIMKHYAKAHFKSNYKC